MKLESLLETIGAAAQEAYKAIEANAVNQFLDGYFDKLEKDSGETVYRPKMIEIEMPSSVSGKGVKVIPAPVAALVRHQSINLDYVKLNLNIAVTEESGGGLQISAQGANPSNEGPQTPHTGTLEVTFQCSEATEGIARIETQLNGMI